MFSNKESHLLHLNFCLASTGFGVKGGLIDSETSGVPPSVAYMGVVFMGVTFMGVVLVGVTFMDVALVGVALAGVATIGTKYESFVFLHFWGFRMEPLELLYTTVSTCFV